MDIDYFKEILDIVARLRGENGCPWDRVQTHTSLKPDLIEETYEVLEAIDEGDDDELCEELGDLLMQVLLHSQIASEEGRFDIEQVIRGLSRKLIRRHPHVFGEVQVSGVSEVLTNWERIKRGEEGNRDRTSILDGIPRQLPALMRAYKVQRKAAKDGFDWDRVEGVLEKIEEELSELKQACLSEAQAEIEEELGDLLFSLVNLSRFLNVDPESALQKAIKKFESRFRLIEEMASAKGEELKGLTLAQMDELWERAKERK